MDSITHDELRRLRDEASDPPLVANVQSARQRLTDRRAARQHLYRTMKRVSIAVTPDDSAELRQRKMHAAHLRHQHQQGQGQPRVSIEDVCAAVLAVLEIVDRLPLVQ